MICFIDTDKSIAALPTAHTEKSRRFPPVTHWAAVARVCPSEVLRVRAVYHPLMDKSASFRSVPYSGMKLDTFV